MEDDVDISALTMEQYIALIPNDIKPGIVNPKIGDDVEFEINTNFMRELRCKLFTGTDDEDTYEHVRTVLEIVDLFHFPGVTHDAIMLRVYPITLKGRAFRWKNRLPKLEVIRNFKQERDETLYHAWERYNDLFYQCPLHYLNYQQTVHIFYTGLDISTRRILESNMFIPLMTPTQALESIQVMADHSHDWYDEITTREIINDVLDNVDAIHESFKGKHLTKEYPLKKRTRHSSIADIWNPWKKPSSNFAKTQLKNRPRMMKGEKVKAITTMGKENMKEPVPRDLSPTPFLGHLKEQVGSPDRTRKTVRMVHITPPDDDYVASATNPMSNKQLNKFKEEFSNITKIAEKEYDNPVIKRYDCETFIRKLLHQVSPSSREMKSQ
ncbi:hypothetical protein Tco_0982731 [Tanacetum coccineum]